MIRPLAPANQRGHSGTMSVATAWGRAAYPPKSFGSGTYIGDGTTPPSSGTPLPTSPDVSGEGSGPLLPGDDTSGGGKTGAVGKGLPDTVGGVGGKAGNGGASGRAGGVPRISGGAWPRAGWPTTTSSTAIRIRIRAMPADLTGMRRRGSGNSRATDGDGTSMEITGRAWRSERSAAERLGNAPGDQGRLAGGSGADWRYTRGIHGAVGVCGRCPDHGRPPPASTAARRWRRFSGGSIPG